MNRILKTSISSIALLVAISMNTRALEVNFGALGVAHGIVDTDSDGVDDAIDNCSAVSNPNQRDTDDDGFGNFCDPDFDNNGIVNLTDVAAMKFAFFSAGSDLEEDLNGDGVVNLLDVGIMKSFFYLPPGPGSTAPPVLYTGTCTWLYEGQITDCNAAICSLVPVFVGDPVIGTLTIYVGDTGEFTLDNTFTGFSFLIGGVIPVEYPNPDGLYLTGSGTVDINTGEFSSGTLNGEFVGGTLGGLGGGAVNDLTTGDINVTIGFGVVFVLGVEGSSEQPDCDGVIVP